MTALVIITAAIALTVSLGVCPKKPKTTKRKTRKYCKPKRLMV